MTTMSGAHPPRYELIGGLLCLDFCNSYDRGRPTAEWLRDYGDLVGWSWRAGVLSAEEAARLQRSSNRNATASLAVLERAHRLRQSLASTFSALALGKQPRSALLEPLNAELAGAMARSQVLATESGFTWVWADGGKALDSMLWPIARSAADLLTSGDLGAVRRCEGRSCGWYFLDTSRNRSRRWCDMRVCGNRAKARRHHERARAGAA
jgi:predicted RNA-binding Zn ribbon-like protein